MRYKQERLYEYELPIAQQTMMNANMNRDVKRKRSPYTIEEFSFFRPKHMSNLPASSFGSAALKLINAKRYPSWALFCIKELLDMADKDYTPVNAAFIAKDAMLLHPTKEGARHKGMLIALESASGKFRDFTSDDGSIIRLKVPEVPTKIIAEENRYLEPPS